VGKIIKELELLNDKSKIEVALNEQDGPMMREYFLEALKNEISIKKKKLETAKRSADFGLAQIKYRFSGKLLDWEPLYDNEKEWYKEQCTRKILVEKCK